MAYYWTAFEWGAYDRDTSDLSMMEDGAYRRLLSLYYQQRHALLANADRLYRACRANEQAERDAVDYVLDRFFELRDGFYYQKRCEEELLKQGEVSDKRSVAGKLGAQKREENRKQKVGKAQANDKQMPTQLHSQSQLQEEKTTSPRKSGAEEKFSLPDWIPEHTWHEYEQMRRRIQKPMTDKARSLAVAKLEGLRARGHPPGDVLEQSVFNSWQGLFEIRSHGNGTDFKPTKAEQQAAATARVVAEIYGPDA